MAGFALLALVAASLDFATPMNTPWGGGGSSGCINRPCMPQQCTSVNVCVRVNTCPPPLPQCQPNWCVPQECPPCEERYCGGYGGGGVYPGQGIGGGMGGYPGGAIGIGGGMGGYPGGAIGIGGGFGAYPGGGMVNCPQVGCAPQSYPVCPPRVCQPVYPQVCRPQTSCRINIKVQVKVQRQITCRPSYGQPTHYGYCRPQQLQPCQPGYCRRSLPSAPQCGGGYCRPILSMYLMCMPC